MLLKIYNPKDPKSKGAIEKMKKRRILAALLSCAMIATALIGCSGDGSSSTASGGSSTGGGEASTSGEKVKLTALFSKHSLTKDVNTMQWLTDLQNECNVEVEWQQQIQP